MPASRGHLGFRSTSKISNVLRLVQLWSTVDEWETRLSCPEDGSQYCKRGAKLLPARFVGFCWIFELERRKEGQFDRGNLSVPKGHLAQGGGYKEGRRAAFVR